MFFFSRQNLIDYPNFLNLLTTSMYVPVCFAYIIPMARNGGIPKEQLDLPYKPFAVMGALDAVAGIMQVFAATYLPGPLIILLVGSLLSPSSHFPSSNNQRFLLAW